MEGRSSRKPGLTLIELLIVLGILGILGLFLARDASQLLSQSHFTNAVERIVRTIRTAQIYSINGREDSSWGIHHETGKLVLFRGVSYAERDPAFDAVTELPPTVVINGWSDIYFDKIRGAPSSSLSIVVESLNRVGTISVNVQGGINRP